MGLPEFCTFWLKHNFSSLNSRPINRFIAVVAVPTHVFQRLLDRGQDFTPVHPDFDAADAISRHGLGSAVINISAQRMKGDLAFPVPFRSGNFCTTQAARTVNPDTLPPNEQLIALLAS